MERNAYLLQPIGVVRSTLEALTATPKQGCEGAPDAWLEIDPAFAEALAGLEAGQELLVLTWLHRARRDLLQVHPRGDRTRPLRGVFATRSPHRPNPIGLHKVRILAVEGLRLRVGPLEAVAGTPLLDLKPLLPDGSEG